MQREKLKLHSQSLHEYSNKNINNIDFISLFVNIDNNVLAKGTCTILC